MFQLLLHVRTIWNDWVINYPWLDDNYFRLTGNVQLYSLQNTILYTYVKFYFYISRTLKSSDLNLNSLILVAARSYSIFTDITIFKRS